MPQTRSIPDLLTDYEAGPAHLAGAVAGLTDDDLLWKPPADAPAELGRWSIKQVVVHVQDADLAFADRFKRITAMKEPVLQGWSENDYIACTAFAGQSVTDAIELVRLLHAQAVRIFKVLPPQAFERTGLHSERGRQTLTDVLTYATWHLDHHVKFIHEKRKFMGKSMW